VKKALKWVGMASGACIGLVAAAGVAGLFVPPEVSANAEVEIDRDPQAVWQVLSRPEELTKWSSEVRRVERIGEGRYRVHGAMGAGEVRIDRLEAPRRMVSSIDMMGVTGKWDITVEPAGAGCRVRTQAHIRFGNPWFRVLTVFMDADEQERKTLLELKGYLELPGRG